jgi:hypothetical protein
LAFTPEGRHRIAAGTRSFTAAATPEGVSVYLPLEIWRLAARFSPLLPAAYARLYVRSQAMHQAALPWSLISLGRKAEMDFVDWHFGQYLVFAFIFGFCH